jgi:hypothetical protein
MRRIMSVLIVVSIAQALSLSMRAQSAGVQTPAVSDAQPRAAAGGPPASDSPAKPNSAANTNSAKTCDDGWKPDMDSPYWWRWQTYHSLDCALAVIDERIGRSGTHTTSEHDVVPVPRGELERLRALAWRARDAAARIDR